MPPGARGKSIGSRPAFRPSNGGLQPSAFAHGDSVTIADICLASVIAVARVFKIEAPDIPTVNRIMARCEKLEAFQRAEPSRQFGAPKAM